MSIKEKTSLAVTGIIMLLLIVITANWVQGFVFTTEKWLD